MTITQLINSLSYTDFVGFINQTNIPPGSLSTVSEWRVFGQVNSNSNILEVACTTGFSITELIRQTGASGFGFDLSRYATESASLNARLLGKLAGRVQFKQDDGYTFIPEETFTHIIVGAALGFFPDKPRMIERMVSFFDGYGQILASPFYSTGEIPQNLIQDAKRILGITPTQESYKDVLKVFEKLIVAYESRKTIYQETPEEIARYCEATIARFAQERAITDSEALEAAYKRLHDIRQVTNDLRRYQGYSVAIFEYRKDSFGKRFIELF